MNTVVRPLSLTTFLTRLIWFSMLPLLLLAVWLAWDNLEKQEQAHLREGENLAHNYAMSVEALLQARINALNMLAISPLAADRRHWPALYAEAQGFQASFDSHVIFADTSRQMLFNTRSPFGTKLPLLPDSKGKTAAPAALKTGLPQVGDIVIGPVSHLPLVAIVVPGLRDGKVAHLMLTTFDTSQLQARLEEIVLPPEWSLALLDSTGAVIARRSPLGLDAVQDVDKDHRFVVPLKQSLWSVVLEIPRRSHWNTHLRPIAYFFVSIALATLLGVMGGTLASRRLGRQVSALVTPTEIDKPALDIVEIIDAKNLLDASLAGQRASEEAQAALLEEQRQARLSTLNRMEDANRARIEAIEASQALRENQERLQLFIDHAPAALAMFDRDMHYLAVSQRWREDYFLGDCQLIGHSHYEIFPEITERWKEIHRRCMAGEVITADEDRFERADGSVQWLRWEVRPWRAVSGGVGGIVVFSEEITRLVAARHEIIELNACLERRVEQRTAELSAANRELDSFAYAVSHDLRAPLRAMSGFSQALQEDYGDRLAGQAMQYLDQIGIASRKMSDLIDGILVLSRSIRGELRNERVDLTTLAAQRLAELTRAEPDHHVATKVEPGLVASGDARMLEVVLTNLIDNAWKYSGKTAAPEIRVFAELRDGKHWYCITDNGAGFDMAHATRLFQPFQRLHRQDEFAGIGIGLATVQRIIHRHGGKIEAHGEPGKGASFCFFLPEGLTEEHP